MFRLVLPCYDSEIKTNEISSDENKEKAYIRFHWIKSTFIDSVLWWTSPIIIEKSVDFSIIEPDELEVPGIWKPKVVCDDWEREYIMPSMNFYDSASMTAEYLIYDCAFNNRVLASDDGAFEIRFKRTKAVPFLIKTPYAGHDVEYNVTVTVPYKELPEAAKQLVEANLEKKRAADAESKRRAGLKRKAEELRAMAAELELQAKHM
jgi:hypothetical protein